MGEPTLTVGALYYALSSRAAINNPSADYFLN